MKTIQWLPALLCLLLISCSGKTSSNSLTEGVWRGVIEMPGGELPFQLEFKQQDPGEWSGVLVNGIERVVIENFQLNGNEILMDFPAFNNRITGRIENGKIKGTLELVKLHGKKQHMPVTITRGETYLFFEKAPDINADYGGKYSVLFTDEDGTESEAVAEFSQRNGHVTGTFRTPTGDYRYLSGEVNDRELYLSTFDGAHAFLFTANMSTDGMVSGDFWSGTEWHESWTAVRDVDASLPDPDAMTTLESLDDKFVVAFPDVNGKLVSSNDAQFQDKVVIVALAGSWCPNCHDEAAFLAPFYKKYRNSGLEVLGLMYEHLDDFDAAATQVQKFRQKFGIEYPLLVAGSSDKKEASKTLPMLSEVIAYPTMIVLDRSGEVRRINTGFNGPGTGETYQEFVTEFTQFIETLLNEEMG